MKRFLAYYFIYRTTKNPIMAAQIYQMIYQNVIPQKTEHTKVVSGTTTVPQTNNGKKEELEQSLLYLKNKTFKTKKDKESINVIESILENI